MTKITLKWQRDDSHIQSYSEYIELSAEEQSIKTSIEERVQRSVQSNSSNPFKLCNLTRTAVALALENCVDQLFIVRALLNEPVVESCFQLFEYKTLRERFTRTPKAAKRHHEEQFEKIPYTDNQKLRDDLCFLTSTLEATQEEIVETGFFTNLLRVLFSIQQQDDDSKELEENARNKHQEAIVLKRILTKETRAFEAKLQESMTALAKLKNAEEDVLAYGKSEIRYVESWETTRRYQNNLVLSGKEGEFKDIIQGSKTNIELENRIHTEIENFIAENTDDLQDGIQYWMHHYDEEIEKRDSEIYQLKMTWESLSEYHVKLRQTYEEHRIAIEDWLAFKEERRIQEELFQLQTRAATRLQAWWRGTMVRKKLGPYRKKKNKKGDKKGKKGKKKK